MVKIGVTGACGRMGRMIINAIHSNKNSVLSSALEHKDNSFIDNNIYAVTGIQEYSNVIIESDIESFASKCDVIIDFSSIESSLNLLTRIRNKKIVIGTTGFNAEQINLIKKYSENAACVFSPNMSIGVNLMFEIAAEIAGRIGNDYDMEIIELHHNKKKDSPSGTAVKLAEVIAESVNRKLDDCAIHGRFGLVGERTKNEIGIHAVRCGDIVGEHTVIYAGNGERIELTHKAHARETFANGSVRAALWLSDKENGFYSMKNVLGF